MTTPRGSGVRLLCLLGILLAAWIAIARFAVPLVIETAYRGQSIPALNRIISGQATHPVEDYLASWNAIAPRVTWILALLGLSLWVVSRPTVQPYSRRSRQRPLTSPPPRGDIFIEQLR